MISLLCSAILCIGTFVLLQVCLFSGEKPTFSSKQLHACQLLYQFLTFVSQAVLPFQLSLIKHSLACRMPCLNVDQLSSPCLPALHICKDADAQVQVILPLCQVCNWICACRWRCQAGRGHLLQLALPHQPRLRQRQSGPGRGKRLRCQPLDSASALRSIFRRMDLPWKCLQSSAPTTGTAWQVRLPSLLSLPSQPVHAKLRLLHP